MAKKAKKKVSKKKVIKKSTKKNVKKVAGKKVAKKASKKKTTKKVVKKSKVKIAPPSKHPIQDKSKPGANIPQAKLEELKNHFQGPEAVLKKDLSIDQIQGLSSEDEGNS